MLEKLKANETWHAPAPSETMTEVFHYFAGHVFARTDIRTREVLMRTALLPWITGPMAEAVSGNPDAAQIIRDLYERGLFVDRRAIHRCAISTMIYSMNFFSIDAASISIRKN